MDPPILWFYYHIQLIYVPENVLVSLLLKVCACTYAVFIKGVPVFMQYL